MKSMLVIHKKIITLFIYLLVVGFLATGFFVALGHVDLSISSSSSLAYAQSDMFGVDYAAEIGLTPEDPRLVVVRILRAALGVLAVIALILIIIAGVIWMTAGGDSKKVEKAQKILLNAVIGLIVILLALAIVQYIFSILNKVSDESRPVYRCTVGEIRNNCWECVDDAYGGTSWRWNPYLPECGGWGPGPNPEYDFAIRQIETSTAGSDYKTNVYQCSRVQTIFNYRVSQGSFSSLAKNVADNDAFKILDSSSNVFSGSWQAVNNVIIFKHPDPVNQKFTQGGYELYNPKALQDVIKRNLEVCRDPLGCDLDTDDYFGWDFNVGSLSDSERPRIVQAYPTHTGSQDRNVDRTPILSVKFSESIDGTTVNPTNVILQRLDRQGGSAVGNSEDLKLSLTNKGFIFSPVNYLEKFAWYRITLQNIEDLCANLMEPVSYSWEFQTNDRAPGIKRVYPPRNATRVCPTTVIAVTFSTSMWDSQVNMLITGTDNTSIDVRMPEPQSMAGPDYIQVPEVGSTDSGYLQIMDTANSREFRTYVYYPQWPLSLNTQYLVSIGTTKQADKEGNMVSGSWSFTTGAPEDCVCMPYITRVTPDQGLRGECITLLGYCFGGMSSSQAAQPSQVLFNGQAGTIGDWDTIYDHYRHSYLTTSIPPTFAESDYVNISLQVDYDNPDYGRGIESNTVSFYVNSNQEATGPCLWSLRPNHVCYGRSILAKGDRFGDDPGANNRSTDQNHFDFSSGSLRVSDSDISGWSERQINLSLPTGAVDGDAFVTASGHQSNPIWFDVSCGARTPCHDNINSCPAGDAICGPRLECRDDGNGTCRCLPSQLGRPCDADTQQAGCQPDNNMCGSGYYCTNSCRCRPGRGIRGPKVMKVWPKCTAACVNTGIGAKFNKKMNTTVFDSNNVKLYECGSDGPVCDLALSPGEVNIAQVIYNDTANEVALVQSANLAVDEWYRVVMRQIVDQDGLSLTNLNFENNTSYSWVFKTKNDPNECEAAGIFITPADLVVRRHKVGVKYNGYVYGSPDNCDPRGQILNSWDYDWAWTSSNTVIADITNNNDNGDNFVDPFQIASVHDREGTTQISTTINPDGHTDTTTLTVKLGIPDCTRGGECPGSVWDLDEMKCTPVINSFSPTSGPIGSCVSIQGCYFGSRQGFGQVNLGDIDGQEVDYPCPSLDQWSEREIIIQIPDDVAIHNSYPLTVITDYGFEVTSMTDFEVTDTCQGVPLPESGPPCLCRLAPNHGGQDTQIDLFGHNFGNLEPLESVNQVLFTASTGEIAANQNVTVWSDNIIKTLVPAGVATGDVTVMSERCRSNSLNFNVTQGGIGDPCDANINTDECEADNNLCAPGLFCDQASECTCQLVAGPSIIGHFPADGSQDVCRNTAVSVTFNELVNTATLNKETVRLEWETEPGYNCDGQLLVKGNYNFFSRVLGLFKDLINLRSSHAQATQWCSVPGSIQAIRLADGSAGCTNVDGCTKVNFYANQILAKQKEYRIFIQGGKSGVKNPRGGYLSNDFISTFETGEIICKIEDLRVTIFIGDGEPATSRGLIDFISNKDYFTCAGTDNCPDDASPAYSPPAPATPGNQHIYLVEPINSEGDILSSVNLDVEWIESDPEDIIEGISDINPNVITEWMKYVTAANNNGEGKVIIQVSDPNPSEDLNFGSAKTTVYITNYLCENPWPSYADGFPFVDTCSAANFSTFYCRDAGEEGFTDDLPALDMAARPCNPSQSVMREHLWTRSDNADAIGVRILGNPQHLSPILWYKQNAPNPTGSASQTTVDGYQAIQDGRTTYVNAANLSGNRLYTNIYLVSYSENADSVTKNIFNQLLDNWSFNININTRSCGDAMTGCDDETDCIIGSCQADKDKVRRDLSRVQDMTTMGNYLEAFDNYCEFEPNVTCAQDSDCQSGHCIIYPPLKAGSYILGRSTSKWPSWSATLGNQLGKALPKDPVNEFYMNKAGACQSNLDCASTPAYPQCYKDRCVDVPINIDPETFWNDLEQVFTCPEYSRVYQYQADSSGQQFYIYANLEYNNHNWYFELPTHFSGATGECRNYQYSSIRIDS